MGIPVVVVDDDETDRYIVQRRLTKTDDFSPVVEFTAGDEFLAAYFNGYRPPEDADQPCVVLMDINMPRMNGFETVVEMQRRMAEGRGPETVVVMMVTSSNNPADREQAKQHALIKGYMTKPIDETGVNQIRELCSAG
ncbi:MAG: response regulator [Burkholderiaceae bacterium]